MLIREAHAVDAAAIARVHVDSDLEREGDPAYKGELYAIYVLA